MDGTESVTTKLNKIIGAIMAFKVTSNFVNAARYSLYKQLSDSKMHKLIGKDWKTFCQEDLSSNQVTVDREIRMIEEFGESFILAAERLGLKKKDLYALDKSFSIADKIAIKDGNLMDGTKKIPLTKEHSGEISDLITKLVEKAKEADADAKKSREELQKKYDTSAAWEKKYETSKAQFEYTNAQLVKKLDQFRPPDQDYANHVTDQKNAFDALCPFLEHQIKQLRKYRKNGQGFTARTMAEFKSLVDYMADITNMYSMIVENLAEGDGFISQGMLEAEARDIRDKWHMDFLKDINDHRVPVEKYHEHMLRLEDAQFGKSEESEESEESEGEKDENN